MSKKHRAQIILLLADGFDEAAAGVVLATLRRAGLPVSVVGLRAGQVKGTHGLVIVPDMSLDRCLETAAPLLALILPGGASHLSRLRLDPRVGALLKQGLDDQTVLVGLDGPAEAMIQNLTAGGAATMGPGNGVSLESFTEGLVRRLVEA